jgi:hypothetical protein
MDDGVAERVGRGQYVHVEDGDAGSEADLVTDLMTDNEGSTETDEPVADMGSDSDPSADGGPRSEDRATEVEEGRESGDESEGGIPLPVSKEVLAVALLVMLAVAYWRVKRHRDDEDDEDDEQEAAPQYTRGGFGGD